MGADKKLGASLLVWRTLEWRSLLGFGTGWQIATGKAPPPPFSLLANKVFL